MKSKRFVQWFLGLGVLSLSWSVQAKNFDTLKVIESSINMDCIDYCVTGICLHMKCGLSGCKVWVSPRVEYNLPDLLVTVYDEVDEQPWTEYRPIQSALLSNVGNHGAGLMQGEELDSQRLRFKNSSAVGHPFHLFLSAMDAATDAAASGIAEGVASSAVDGAVDAAKSGAIEAAKSGTINGVIDTVKSATIESTIEAAKQGVVDAAKSAVESAKTGAITLAKTAALEAVTEKVGKDAVAAAAVGVGVVKIVKSGVLDGVIDAAKEGSLEGVKEGLIDIADPEGSIEAVVGAVQSGGLADMFESPDFKGFCPANTTPFQPYFDSTLDYVEWRFAFIERIKAVTTGNHWFGRREIGSRTTTKLIGTNTWGAVWPRFGFVLQQEDPKAAAIIAQRTADIVTRSDNWHIHFKAKGPVSNEQKDMWQMISPKLDQTCKPFGSTDSSWSTGRNPDGKEQYGWNYWRNYSCCLGGGNVREIVPIKICLNSIF